MTISATPSQVSYSGNGVSVAFPIPFVFDIPADIKVILTDHTGAISVLSTGFSITGGGGSTGICTFVAAPSVLTSITLLDDPTLTQDADYTANDSFPAESHERALDRCVRQIKRLYQITQRSIRVADGDFSDGSNNLLPIFSSRSGKFLSFDANGNPTIASGTGGGDAALRTDLASGASGAEGARLVAFKHAGTSAVALAVQSILAGWLTPEMFGAIGDGVTDDTLAVRAAQAQLEAEGGGTLLFSPGKTYLFATVSTYSVVVPVVTATFQPQTQSMQYHVLIANKANITWRMNGATLKSTTTSGGTMFLLDGVQNFAAIGGTVQSVTAKDASGTVTTAGMQAFGFTSQTRDSWGIKIQNLTANNVYIPVYTFGDPSGSFRVTGVDVDTLTHNGGVYTLAFHDNGDNIHARNVYSNGANRELFCYGVDQITAEIKSSTLAYAGFASNIKAYSRDTTRIHLKLRTPKSSSAYNVNLESQHAPAVQANPARLINVHVDCDNRDNAGNLIAVGFQYYRDNTPTATSNNNIWTGIKLSGIHIQPPQINSTQIGGGAASYGTLDTDGLVLLNGSAASLYQNTGFTDPKQTYSTFTPNLKFGGATTGITYGGSTKGEYWRDGRFIEGYLRIVLTSKGSATGTATIDLPVPSSALNVVNAMIIGDGQSNMSGLSGPIIGFVSLGGATMTLRIQGAAGSSSVADTNFTNTSDLRLWFRYPGS